MKYLAQNAVRWGTLCEIVRCDRIRVLCWGASNQRWNIHTYYAAPNQLNKGTEGNYVNHMLENIDDWKTWENIEFFPLNIHISWFHGASISLYVHMFQFFSFTWYFSSATINRRNQFKWNNKVHTYFLFKHSWGDYSTEEK